MGIELSGTVGTDPAGEFTIDGTVTITICPLSGSTALEEYACFGEAAAPRKALKSMGTALTLFLWYGDG